MRNFRKGRKGCCTSKGCYEPVNRRGGIIRLGTYWLLNHYGGKTDGFLGWMVLQPRYHRMDLTDLTLGEAASMGRNIQRVDRALRRYWSDRFPKDPIQRVYVVYFHESVFGETQTCQPNEEWHLHIHLIPRTRRLGQLLRRHSCDGSIEAWSIGNIAKLHEGEFPSEYRKNNMNMSRLVRHLRHYLAGEDSEMPRPSAPPGSSCLAWHASGVAS